MKPLILIAAAGGGKRLRPLTENVPKPFIEIGNKRLIDLVMDKLPDGIEKVVLLKKDEKFGQLERHLRGKYHFGDGSILYQDRITSSPHLPREFAPSEIPLAYYLGFFPVWLSRNSRTIRSFDPIVLVPCDVIVEGLNYLDLVEYHAHKNADITMAVKQGFVKGSNTRAYIVRDGRFVTASDYIEPPFDKKLAEDERIYTSEGTYVFGKTFFDLRLHQLIVYCMENGFARAFKTLKLVPYESDFSWIDVADHQNLKIARERYGKK